MNRIGRKGNAVKAVNVGRGALECSFVENSRAYQAFAGATIFYVAANSELLPKGQGGDDQKQ